jgi:hypothetical protein
MAMRRRVLWGSPVLFGVAMALCFRILWRPSATAGMAGSRGGARLGRRDDAMRRGLSQAFDRMSVADRQRGTGDGEGGAAEESREQHRGEQGPGRTPQSRHDIATQSLHRASVEPR